jgi:alkylhydroperoxidase family enzyme
MSGTGALSPLPDGAWPAEIGELRREFAGALNVYRTMAHHPRLLAAWVPLRRHVVLENSLPPRLQELVVLRTAFHARSRYEWSHHVARALAAGLSRQEIDAAGCGSPAAGFDRLEQDVVLAVDELQASSRLPVMLRDRLRDRLSAQQVLDLMALVGFYHVLAFMLETFDIPLDDGVRGEVPIGWDAHG